MYNFCGVKVTRKRFWELSEVASDLSILEKELDKEEGRIIDESLVQELLNSSKVNNTENSMLLLDSEIDQILNLNEKSDNLNCSHCGSRLVLKKSKWGSFLACSNISDCETIEVLG
ncbi:MAG: topoisomerase DNA-binding C4 zinc finger domain-containing protein [archaeon]|jgi:hypothetical protein